MYIFYRSCSDLIKAVSKLVFFVLQDLCINSMCVMAEAFQEKTNIRCPAQCG